MIRSFYLFLIFSNYFACFGGISELKNDQKTASNTLIEIDSEVGNPHQLKEFLQIIENKDCFNFKKWLGSKFIYSLGEGEAMYAFFFYRQKHYRETSYAIDVCEFMFNQKSFDSVILAASGRILRVNIGYEIIVNAKEIEISSESDVSKSLYRLHMQVTHNPKLGFPNMNLPTMLIFDCDTRKHSKCFLVGLNTWYP